MNNSKAEAIQSYQEADKLLKLLQEKHADWNKPIVEFRARKVADALKRLAPPPDTKKPE